MSTTIQSRPVFESGFSTQRLQQVSNEIVEGLNQEQNHSGNPEAKKMYGEAISAYKNAERLAEKLPKNTTF